MSQIRLGVMHGPAETLGLQVSLWRSPSPSPDSEESFVKSPSHSVCGVAQPVSRE